MTIQLLFYNLQIIPQCVWQTAKNFNDGLFPFFSSREIACCFSTIKMVALVYEQYYFIFESDKQYIYFWCTLQSKNFDGICDRVIS